MTELLKHTAFFDVLFPPSESSRVQDFQDFKLRRLKRYVPKPLALYRQTPLVVFDFETTGLDYEADRIIEIGAQKLENFVVKEEFDTLLTTEVLLTKDITRITGITSEMLRDQPKAQAVLPKFLDFIRGSILVAHNAEFDFKMLKAECSRQGIDLEWPCFCTLKMARELLAGLENKKLDTLAHHYGLTFEKRHRSLGDVKVTTKVLENMLEQEAQHILNFKDLTPYIVT
jgi:DNA polymerase III subunit epsilon